MRRYLAVLVWVCVACGSAADHYRTLGVKSSANQGEIRTAYRSLAKKLHPDKNPDDPGAVAKFHEVASAYEVLNDAAERRRYDEERRYGSQRGGRGGGGFEGFAQQQQQQQQRGGGRPQYVRVVIGGREFLVPAGEFFQNQQAGAGYAHQRQRQREWEERQRGGVDAGLLLQLAVLGLAAAAAYATMANAANEREQGQRAAERKRAEARAEARRAPVSATDAPAAPANTHSDDCESADTRRSGERPEAPVVVSASSSIRELKQEALRRGLNIDGCAEKSDLVHLLALRR